MTEQSQEKINEPKVETKSQQKRIDIQTRGLDRKERFQEINKDKRPPRIPLGHHGKLGMPAQVKNEDGKHYYWASDGQYGSLQEKIDAYWEFVYDDSGDRVTRNTGNIGTKLYLMCVDDVFWQEDFAELQKANIDTLNKRAALNAGEYIPVGHDSVINKKKATSSGF